MRPTGDGGVSEGSGGICPMSESRYAINRTDVVDEVIDGEAILINLRTGSYYSLDGAACAIWERLRRGPADSGDVTRLVSRAAEHAGPGFAEAAVGFLSELAAEGLIEPSDDPAPEIDDSGIEVGGTPPVLSKYTDMEALLLIDPIHDVTPGGGPARRDEGDR